MKDSGKLEISTPSDREIAMTRVFDAPRKLVFEAWTRPDLVQRWLGVQNGWSLAVCEIDLRVGGKYRYVWRGPGRPDMGMGGVYLEVVAPERFVASEKFDQAWYDGEAVATTTFVERGGKTTVTMTLRYASKTVRDTVLQSPMEQGVGASFDKLADLLIAGAA